MQVLSCPFYSPSNKVKAQINEKSTVESSTHLAHGKKTVSFNNPLVDYLHSCFYCHLPSIRDRLCARLHAEFKKQGSNSVSKTGQKRNKIKGGVGHPARFVCWSWMRTCSRWTFWSPEALCHFGVHSQGGLRMIVCRQSSIAPKSEQLLYLFTEEVLMPSLYVSAWTTS